MRSSHRLTGVVLFLVLLAVIFELTGLRANFSLRRKSVASSP